MLAIRIPLLALILSLCGGCALFPNAGQPVEVNELQAATQLEASVGVAVQTLNDLYDLRVIGMREMEMAAPFVNAAKEGLNALFLAYQQGSRDKPFSDFRREFNAVQTARDIIVARFLTGRPVPRRSVATQPL